jgi:polyvinyl alcohol dehydrogenase (cytochrome)
MSSHPSAARRVLRTLCTAAIMTMAAWSGAQAAITRCSDFIDPQSPVLSNGFAFNVTNTRNQVSAIHSGNVATLQQAMAHVAPKATEKRGAPAVTQQTLYFSEINELVARNRQSGCEYWRWRVPFKLNLLMSNNVRSSSVYLLPPQGGKPALVFAGDAFGAVHALNAATGRLVWSTQAGTDTARHMLTGGMQVHEGTLFVPVATREVVSTILDFFGTCCKSHGMLQALDAYTGKVKWSYHTADKAMLDRETGNYAPNGMSIWSTPLIDADNRQIVIGTGQNLSPPATQNSDSVIALDIDTGRVKWLFQATSGDTYNMSCDMPSALTGHCPKTPGPDFDFGAPPILVTLPSGEKLLLAGSKNGTVYAFDPATGARKWQTRLGVGGVFGGIHWGMATDGKVLFAAVTDLVIDRSRTQDLLKLSGGKLPMAASVGARPGIYALDIRDGRIVWEQHPHHTFEGQSYESLYSAAVSVTNDVLFAGSLDGIVRAFRTNDGKELWSFDTVVSVTDVDGEAGQGGTIDSVGPVPAGSELYVNSGYSAFGGRDAHQGGNGNALFVLRLP